MSATSRSTESEQSRRPCASVLGADVVGVALVAAGLALVGAGLARVAGVGLAGVVAGAGLAGVVAAGFAGVVTAGLAAVVTVGLAAEVTTGVAAVVTAALVAGGTAPVVVSFPGAGTAAVLGAVRAGVDATGLPAAALATAAVENGTVDEPVALTAALLEGGVEAFTDDCIPAAAALDSSAAALDAVADGREARTPVSVGTADPLTAAVLAVAPGVPPFDRPPTTKITATRAAMSTTMKITRRSQ